MRCAFIKSSGSWATGSPAPPVRRHFCELEVIIMVPTSPPAARVHFQRSRKGEFSGLSDTARRGVSGLAAFTSIGAARQRSIKRRRNVLPPPHCARTVVCRRMLSSEYESPLSSCLYTLSTMDSLYAAQKRRCRPNIPACAGAWIG